MHTTIGDRLGQAGALLYLGAMRRLTGDYPGAARILEQALGIYQDHGYRLGQVHALLRQALEIFQRTGAAEAGDVFRELTALTEPGPPA